MKSSAPFAISLLACTLSIFIGNVVQAQSVADRFLQLDKDKDGKLNTAEAGTLGFFKPADTDRDGLVTLKEAEAFANKSSVSPTKNSPTDRNAGMEGDGAAPVFYWPVQAIKISESECPVRSLETRSADGKILRAWWRKPVGEGTFPTIIFIHGGLRQFPDKSLQQHLTDNPVITRFLSMGYSVVMTTFRTYEQDVQAREPIEDVRAILGQTAKLPHVDPKRIALYGGSGGGSIAMELAGDPEVSAIIAGEPATVLYTGMLTTGDYGPRLEMMASPEKFFTPELRAKTAEKLKSIRIPVLILHGDKHDLIKLNKPLFLPLMQEVGVDVKFLEYPGYGHGFYFGGGEDRWGKGADEEVVQKVVSDVHHFLSQAMKMPVQ